MRRLISSERVDFLYNFPQDRVRLFGKRRLFNQTDQIPITTSNGFHHCLNCAAAFHNYSLIVRISDTVEVLNCV